MPQQPLHPCLLPVCHRYPAFASVTNPHAFELAGVRMLGTSGQPVADALKYAQAEGGEADSIGVLEDMLNWWAQHAPPRGPRARGPLRCPRALALRSPRAAAAAGGGRGGALCARAGAGGGRARRTARRTARSASRITTDAPGRAPSHWLGAAPRRRHIAPSAPDTLPCFPFATTDPFITVESPHVFFAGNQPKYGTKLVRGPAGQVCRLVAVPAFSSTQTAVLLNLRTLRCHPITFDGLSHLPP